MINFNELTKRLNIINFGEYKGSFNVFKVENIFNIYRYLSDDFETRTDTNDFFNFIKNNRPIPVYKILRSRHYDIKYEDFVKWMRDKKREDLEMFTEITENSIVSPINVRDIIYWIENYHSYVKKERTNNRKLVIQKKKMKEKNCSILKIELRNCQY